MSKIRESAKGEVCLVRIPDVCNFNPETTVLAHANGSAAGKGIGMKSDDRLGAYCCSACHDVIDRRNRPPAWIPRAELMCMFWEGHARTLLKLIEKGLVR